MKIVWTLTSSGVVKNLSEVSWMIGGQAVPEDVKITSTHLAINGSTQASDHEMNAVSVSFNSTGAQGGSYCDSSTSPMVHYADSFKVSPGMKTVEVKIQNGSGHDLNVNNIEFEIEYEQVDWGTAEIAQPEKDVWSTTILIKKLHPGAVIPSYANDGDVGMDMTAISVEYDVERDMYIYHTGIAMESDYGLGVFLFPRSSNCKTDAYLTNHVGIVDSYLYRGEVQFRYKNRDAYRKSLKERISGKVDIERAIKFAPYKVGDRIGQMVAFVYPKVKCKEVNELSETVRGAGGFGSTGK